MSQEEKMHKSEQEWKDELGDDLYEVARNKATEPAFTGKYVDTKEKGKYKCAACGFELFSSDTKYDSGSGWPSFTEPIGDSAVETDLDTSHGMRRTEVMCARCGAHLGHVFADGPGPDGQRYCINSISLDLEGEQSTPDEE